MPERMGLRELRLVPSPDFRRSHGVDRLGEVRVRDPSGTGHRRWNRGIHQGLASGLVLISVFGDCLPEPNLLGFCSVGFRDS